MPTIIDGGTCTNCGEEFATFAESRPNGHPCREWLDDTQQRADVEALLVEAQAMAPAPGSAQSLRPRSWLMSDRDRQRLNRFAGRCRVCQHHVEANEGRLVGNSSLGYFVEHNLGRCPATTPVARASRTVTVGPDEVHMLDGVFFRTRRSRSTGRTFAQRAIVRTGTWGDSTRVQWVMARGSVFELSESTRLTSDQAREFGVLNGVCIRCTRTLTDERSVAAGYGAVCARRMGWHYPSHDEAVQIIAARDAGAAPANEVESVFITQHEDGSHSARPVEQQPNVRERVQSLIDNGMPRQYAVGDVVRIRPGVDQFEGVEGPVVRVDPQPGDVIVRVPSEMGVVDLAFRPEEVEHAFPIGSSVRVTARTSLTDYMRSIDGIIVRYDVDTSRPWVVDFPSLPESDPLRRLVFNGDEIAAA